VDIYTGMNSEPSHFFKKLINLLNSQEHDEIFHWNSNKAGFSILDQTQFIDFILQIYFPELNIERFISKLKKIGFKVIKTNNFLSFKFKEKHKENPLPIKKISDLIQIPSRKKTLKQSMLSVDLDQLENLQLLMEQKVSTLEKKFEKIISLNIFLISELNKSSKNEKSKYSELLKHLQHFQDSNS
jgi:hypothetical protein